jgi:DNA polymerase-3 subunit delta'
MAPSDTVGGWPVWGHAEAVDGLRRAVRGHRIGHAYLFAGPDGVGKGLLARTLAQAEACEGTDRANRADACGMCRACRRITRGIHPDVEWWSLARQAAADKGSGKNATLTIETVRQLRASTALRPLEARRRFVIVDDAEAMQGPAQEALLKTLEEPPPSVTIVLLASDGDALLPTIRSRCQCVELRPVAAAAILAGLEGSGVATVEAREIAAMANGRPGWAIRAAADPAMLAERRQSVARAVEWIAAPVGERVLTAARLGDAFGKKREDVFADLETLQSVWRDAMLAAAGAERFAIHRAELTRIGAATGTMDAARAARAVAAVQRCVADLEANVRPRLALEGMVLEWPSTGAGGR